MLLMTSALRRTRSLADARKDRAADYTAALRDLPVSSAGEVAGDKRQADAWVDAILPT